MPIAVSIQDQVYNIPLIDELTIKHLIDLRRVRSDADRLQWGVGQALYLKDSKRTIREVGNALTLINNLIEEVRIWMQSDERIAIPKTVELLGVEVKINPGLIQELPYWGTERCREVIRRETKDDGRCDYTDHIPEIIAHYLYEKVTRSRYDEDKADEFVEVINHMNMKEAIQLGNFFLLKQTQYFLNRRSYWLTRLTVTRKRLGLKFLASLGRLIHWKR